MKIADKCFKPLYGKCTRTDEDFYKDDCGLPVSDKDRAKLCQELGEEYFTYLVFSDGFCHEIVKVYQSNGQLFTERGVDDTPTNYWACGTNLKFDWTRSGIKALSEYKSEEDEADCPEELFTGEIKNGNCTVRFKEGKAVESKPNKIQINDGCYTNPVITYEDGCPVRVAEGSDVTRYQSVCGHTPHNGTCG